MVERRASHTPTPPQLLTVKQDLGDRISAAKISDLNATYDLGLEKEDDGLKEDLEKTFDLNKPIADDAEFPATPDVSIKIEEAKNDNVEVSETQAQEETSDNKENVSSISKNQSDFELEKDIEEMTAQVMKSLNNSSANKSNMSLNASAHNGTNTSLKVASDTKDNSTIDTSSTDKENLDTSKANISIETGNTTCKIEVTEVAPEAVPEAADTSGSGLNNSSLDLDRSPSNNSSLRRGTFTVTPKVAMVSPMAVAPQVVSQPQGNKMKQSRLYPLFCKPKLDKIEKNSKGTYRLRGSVLLAGKINPFSIKLDHSNLAIFQL